MPCKNVIIENKLLKRRNSRDKISESKNGKPCYIAINVESTVRKRQIEDQLEKHQLLPCFALILKRC